MSTPSQNSPFPPTPQYLYKIVSEEDWLASQGKRNLLLPDFDKAFIHLATHEQLDRIVKKFWSESAGFYVLRVAYEQLEGRCVLEANPGGLSLYYHLYEGSIPMSSVQSYVFFTPTDFEDL
jgi:uncharacterized protein (DUF952 family)